VAKSLDRTITHHGVPFLGRKGNDQFHFSVPLDERYKEARLDVVSGRHEPGARIVAQPSAGETGADKTVEVQWWFDGSPDLVKPPFITYRVRAFTVPVVSRAILVAIENTGQLPLPLGISDDLKEVIERFVDTITELIAAHNARNLFAEYYRKAEVLVDTDCTKEKIRDKIVELGKEYVLDLAILGHGAEYPPGSGQGVLVLHGGMDDWTNNPNNLRETDVQAWMERPDFQDLELGLVYMMNCYGSRFNDAWCRLGFKTSVGSQDENWMPEPMFTFFWTRFRNGETAEDAARKAWEASRELWQVIHRPECRLVPTPQPPYISLQCEDNAKIAASRCIIAGEPALMITDEARDSSLADDDSG